MSELTVITSVSFKFAGLTIDGKTFTMTTPPSALANAQAADVAVTAEIAKYISDVATALNTAIANGDTAAVQKIADDLNADATNLTTADTTVAPVTPTA